MDNSKIVLVSQHVNDPNIGMSFMLNQERFKLYLANTVLFVTLMFWNKSYTENSIYEKLLHNKLAANLGYLYENITAQILTAKGDKLFYHTMFDEITKKNYEADFILSRKNKICSIEVKSSNYLTHKSLDVFYDKYHGRILEKYLVYN